MVNRATAAARVIGMVVVSALVFGGCMSMRGDSMMKKDDGAMMKKDDTMMDKK